MTSRQAGRRAVNRRRWRPPNEEDREPEDPEPADEKEEEP